jgi:hypothetical protein
MLFQPSNTVKAVFLFFTFISSTFANDPCEVQPGEPQTVQTKLTGVLIKYTETICSFTLQITGAGLGAGDRQTKHTFQDLIDIGKYWSIPLTIEIAKGDLNGGDSISVSGTAVHVARPHGEPADGGVFSFSAILADDKKVSFGGVRAKPNSTGQYGQIEPHPPHLDSYILTASAITHGAGGLFNFIDSWNMTLQGSHPPAIPEPDSILLALFGVATIWHLRVRGK